MKDFCGGKFIDLVEAKKVWDAVKRSRVPRTTKSASKACAKLAPKAPPKAKAVPKVDPNTVPKHDVKASSSVEPTSVYSAAPDACAEPPSKKRRQASSKSKAKAKGRAKKNKSGAESSSD